MLPKFRVKSFPYNQIKLNAMENGRVGILINQSCDQSRFVYHEKIINIRNIASNELIQPLK